MADVCIVNANVVYAYSKKNTSSSIQKTYYKGDEVKIYKKEIGKNNVQYGNAAKNGNKWINMAYLTTLTTVDTESDGKKTKDNVGIAAENTDSVEDDTLYGNDDSSYNKLMLRYIHAFGSPPRFTEEVDPYYSVSGENQVGRSMGTTWFSNPSIFSLCPGTVDYLPGFSRKNKKKFFNKVVGSMNDGLKSLAGSDYNTDANGQLYAFKSAYKDYINVVNLLARVSANYLGIGDVKDLFYGSKIALNSFDYGYYTSASKSKSHGLFDITEIMNAFNTAVSDSAYVHFFVNHSGGVNASDSFTTTQGESWLEQKFGSNGQYSEAARNIQFLFGGAIGGEATQDLEAILQEASSSSELLGSMATIAKNYLKGGRLVFPKMIVGMDYNKSISVEMSFTSVYGDKRSIFKYVILPSLHLLALATPKQLSSNMYTYPFLVRAYERGNTNTDLAFISNLELTRGGSDNTSWTVDGLATEITARFTVTPLYTNMMVTSSVNPFLFMQNSALMEYLGTMCGIDLKANNIDVKVKLAKELIANKTHDTPTNIARGIVDTKLVNEIRKFTHITN